MATRLAVDHRLQLKLIPVSFLDGTDAEARAEGNNAAWRCLCGALLVGRCYFQFGDTCHTECDCGRKYRVSGDAKKRAQSVSEVAA
jgi:hypothetical protein